MKYLKIILLILNAAIVSGASPVKLTNTSGTTIEVEILEVAGSQVTFSRIPSHTKHTIDIGLLDERSQGIVSDWVRNQQAVPYIKSNPTLLWERNTIDGMYDQPFKREIRPLHLKGNTLTYEIPLQHQDVKIPKDEFTEILRGWVRDGRFRKKISNEPWKKLQGVHISMMNNEVLTVKRYDHSHVYAERIIPFSGPHETDLHRQSKTFRQKIKDWLDNYERARESRRKELLDLMPHSSVMKRVTPSDTEFDQWIMSWYLTHFLEHPDFPIELVEHFLSDPELRIAFLDALTLPLEAHRVRNTAIHRIRYLTMPREDHIPTTRRIISDLYERAPERTIEHFNLALALSLIYDQPNVQNFFVQGEDNHAGWYTPYRVVFDLKTDHTNIHKLMFEPEDLTIEQNIWANAIGQPAEVIDWAIKTGVTENYDDEWGSTPTSLEFKTGPDLRDLQGVCWTLSWALHERLMALNVPSAHVSGWTNNMQGFDEGHSYLELLSPDGPKTAARGTTVGMITFPSNNFLLTGGLFRQQMGKRYTSPEWRKLRLKTLFAESQPSKTIRNRILRDIHSEDPEFGPAKGLLAIEGLTDDNRIRSNNLDNAEMNQKLMKHHLNKRDIEKAKEYFHAMLKYEDDEQIRFGRIFTTITEMDVDDRLAFIPEAAEHISEYPVAFKQMLSMELTLTGDALEEHFSTTAKNMKGAARDTYSDYEFPFIVNSYGPKATYE